MIEILNCYTKAVLYTSATANYIAEAVEEAVKGGANLSGADLSGAYLRGANLRGTDLRGTDLRGANLSGAKNITPKVLQILGTKHAVIVHEYGTISIGCHTKTLAWWEQHYASIGQKEEYTVTEIAEYGEHIAACRRFMERYSLLEAPKEEAQS